MTEDGKVITLLLIFGGATILVVLTNLLIRTQQATKRNARNLERIELRLDKIEAVMTALPQMLVEAYKQMEARRERRNDDQRP